MQTVCWASLLSLGLMGCFCSAGYPAVEESSPVDDRLVSANTSFGFNLFEKLVERNPDGNTFVSPASIAMALAMTYNGANGDTQEAMAKTLELQGMSLEEVNQASAALMERLKNLGDDVLLNIANSLWAREGEEFKADFLKRNRDFYQAYIDNLDFDDPKAASVINAWVKEKTQGKIEDMVNEIPKGVILYLINAVYFKGIWGIEFNEEYTKERDFTLLDGSKKKVPMMMASSKGFRAFMGQEFDAVALPYGDGKVSMYIFVPHRESSLKEFYRELNAGSWEGWIPQLRQQEIILIMPRFKLEYDVKLNDALAELGMGMAFGKGANFEGMCPGGGVWIDEVKHKTYLEVNEKGTEAAAATSVRMKKGPATYVHVDRPFFCAIRDDETGAVLFMGSIVEP